MDRYDKDQDGRLSMDEYLGNSTPVFFFEVFDEFRNTRARQACRYSAGISKSVFSQEILIFSTLFISLRCKRTKPRYSRLQRRLIVYLPRQKGNVV